VERYVQLVTEMLDDLAAFVDNGEDAELVLAEVGEIGLVLAALAQVLWERIRMPWTDWWMDEPTTPGEGPR